MDSGLCAIGRTGVRARRRAFAWRSRRPRISLARGDRRSESHARDSRWRMDRGGWDAGNCDATRNGYKNPKGLTDLWGFHCLYKKQRVIAPGRAITRDGLLWGGEQTHLLPKLINYFCKVLAETFRIVA